MNNTARLSFIAFIFSCCVGLTACSEKIEQLTPLNDNAVILAFGDSLTFGTGSNSATESYPAVLQRLTGRNVINAGIPGEISADGLERLPALLEQKSPDLVIICHGGNDLIRRLNTKQLQSNIEQMLKVVKESGAELILVAVPSFNLRLDVPELYTNLATQYSVPIEADIIREIGRNKDLKSDTVHPNAHGYTLFAESLYTLLQQSGAITSN